MGTSVGGHLSLGRKCQLKKFRPCEDPDSRIRKDAPLLLYAWLKTGARISLQQGVFAPVP